ncbi:hypothetical protein C6N75_21585 [Streptomyces solincola]|uniref:Uncharacterized protein n=1 Tax=Streptomyces solincola TaxID=2100817 RepID=A0A2S9PS02_9ACTN|nr:hypothetical protein C6N75_21585 [Streptomyces solincola]
MGEATDVDGEWEYVTYAPRGEKCTACRCEVQPLDPVRRSTVKREPDGPVAVYRHAGECPPLTQTATA